MAASEGYTEICQLLLDHGADVKSHTEYGKTPLVSESRYCYGTTTTATTAATASLSPLHRLYLIIL